MEFKHLLAKSCNDPDNPPPAATLVWHTEAVIESIQTMFSDTNAQATLLARHWLRFFKLSEVDFSPFWMNGMLACVFHDLGIARH